MARISTPQIIAIAASNCQASHARMFGPVPRHQCGGRQRLRVQQGIPRRCCPHLLLLRPARSAGSLRGLGAGARRLVMPGERADCIPACQRRRRDVAVRPDRAHPARRLRPVRRSVLRVGRDLRTRRRRGAAGDRSGTPGRGFPAPVRGGAGATAAGTALLRRGPGRAVPVRQVRCAVRTPA
jgi:hypothetical protein